MTQPLKLTIGAATDPWGRPSFVSKEERAVFHVPPEQIAEADEVLFTMQQKKGGGGSLIDQFLDLDDVYKKVKGSEIVQDLVAIDSLETESPAPAKEKHVGGGGDPFVDPTPTATW